jgi:SSS family solute:Na+ symporter
VAVVAGLYTRWLHRWALLAGWAVGMIYGTLAAYHQKSAVTQHFGGSLATFPFTHTKVYIAFSALALNLVVAVVLTLVLRAIKAPAGADQTVSDDYYSETAEPAGKLPGSEGLPAPTTG